MQAYDHLEFLKLISRTSSNAFMLLTVNPDLIDAHQIATSKALSALTDEARDLAIIDCAGIIVFNTIEEAMTVYQSIEANLPGLPHVDLTVMVFYEGYSLLNLSQDNDFISALGHSASIIARV